MKVKQKRATELWCGPLPAVQVRGPFQPGAEAADGQGPTLHGLPEDAGRGDAQAVARQEHGWRLAQPMNGQSDCCCPPKRRQNCTSMKTSLYGESS
jgi:hypothetical protein